MWCQQTKNCTWLIAKPTFRHISSLQLIGTFSTNFIRFLDTQISFSEPRKSYLLIAIFASAWNLQLIGRFWTDENSLQNSLQACFASSTSFFTNTFSFVSTHALLRARLTLKDAPWKKTSNEKLKNEIGPNLTPVMSKTLNRICDHGSYRPDEFAINR